MDATELFSYIVGGAGVVFGIASFINNIVKGKTADLSLNNRQDNEITSLKQRMAGIEKSVDEMKQTHLQMEEKIFEKIDKLNDKIDRFFEKIVNR